MNRIALFLVTALALVAVAGCGSSNKEQNDYVEQVNAVDAKAKTAFSDLGAASSSPAKAAQSFDKAADRLEPIIADYKAIDPPDNAKAAHAETIAGVTGLVALLRQTANEFRAAKTPAELTALAEKTANITSAKPFRQLDDARAKLAKAGYKVEGNPTTTK
jgi:cysteinyl-tRNA synthetase